MLKVLMDPTSCGVDLMDKLTMLVVDGGGDHCDLVSTCSLLTCPNYFDSPYGSFFPFIVSE